MRWERILGLLLTAGLMSGCDVVRGGIFIAAVPHYHGGETRVVPKTSLDSETQTERAPESLPSRTLPRIPTDQDE
jgi:hypothetical protein